MQVLIHRDVLCLFRTIPDARFSLTLAIRMKEYVDGTGRHHSIAFHASVIVVAPDHCTMTAIAHGSLFNSVHHGAVFTLTGSTFSVDKHIIRYRFLI